MITCEKAKAKINLFLRVLKKRDDGYHELQSIAVFTKDIFDTIMMEYNDYNSKNDIIIKGDFSDNLKRLPKKDNLVIKTLDIMQMHYDYNIDNILFTLYKNIPVASGVGGGSGDSAAVIRFLQKILKDKVNKNKIYEIARIIGADVPICLEQKNCIMSGLGENISSITLPEFYVVLINPLIEMSTNDIFSKLNWDNAEQTAIDIPTKFSTVDEMVGWLKQHPNDLQPISQKVAPQIKDAIKILEQHDDCMISRMSGSGATCFGVFKDKENALKVSSSIRKQYPNLWNRVSQV